MFDLEPVFQFSRINCVAICGFLVPANLTATIATLILVAMNQPLSRIRWSLGVGSIFAVTLFLHISTWFIVGVVTPVTFILFALGSCCLVINVLAVAYRREIVQISTKLSRT